MGRALRHDRPWPTFEQSSRRFLGLIAAIGATQFFVDAFESLLSKSTMFWVRTLAGIAVGLLTFRIERFMARQRRLGR